MNNPNYILDYEQVLDILEELSKTTGITKEKDIGVSKYGLPISCYSIGKGDKSVVVTGSTHGSEIITTDFVLQLMKNLSSSNEKYLDDMKIYFIPMLNPEGYLITTSAIRAKIPRSASIEEQEKFAKEYYLAYKSDDIEAIKKGKNQEEPDRTRLKHHQEIFKDVDANCISDKYKSIRDSVLKIYQKYPDLPKGSLVTWSANADGIDLQANSKYNPSIEKIQRGEIIYKDNLRHSNIQISHPGPINCAFDNEKGFEYTNEVKALNAFLGRLYENNELEAYYNFHSTGGVIYQRPYDDKKSSKGMQEKTVENYFFSKIYAGKKEHNSPSYKIERNPSKRTSTNDSFRIMYPVDLLVELSPMGGNPVGPYGDKDCNYRHTIDSNIKAFKSSMKVFEISKMLTKEMNMSFMRLPQKSEIMNTYDVIDMIYDEFYNKINRMNGVMMQTSEKNNTNIKNSEKGSNEKSDER